MTFAPLIPWPFLLAAAAIVITFTGWLVLSGRERGREVTLHAIRAAAVVLLLLAALRPGWPGGEAKTARAELDVFFVVDTSTSMSAEDYKGTETRLSGVRTDILAVAKELAGAKFSLITFDNKASVRMPLSQDATALQTAVTTMQPQNPRYAAGSTITAAGNLLKDRLTAARTQHPGRPALVFYAGDGENTAAQAPGRFAVDSGDINGGAVLGYGTKEGGRMKDPSGPGYVRDKNNGDAISRADEEALKAISAQLNVPYVHRAAGDSPSPMLSKATPGSLQSTVDGGPGRVELYWLMSLAAFLLLMHEPLRHAAALRSLRGSSEGRRKEPGQ